MANNENLKRVVNVFGTSVFHWAEVVNPVAIGFRMQGIKESVLARISASGLISTSCHV